MRDDERAFVAPSRTVQTPAAPPPRHDRREGFNARRGSGRAGSPGRVLPINLPPWAAIDQPTRRWLAAGGGAALGPDRRAIMRGRAGRADQPTAVSLAGRPRPRTPARGPRLALPVTPATAAARDQGAVRAEAVQDAIGQHVEPACVDQGETGERPAAAADAPGSPLAVGKVPDATHGCVWLPRRWVGERSVAGAAVAGARRVMTHAGPKPAPACLAAPAPVCCSIVAPPSSPLVHNPL